MSADHLAKEAERLKNDPIFQRALDDMERDALMALARANADDKTAILRLQQRFEAIQEIHAMLNRYIMAADVQENPGSFA